MRPITSFLFAFLLLGTISLYATDGKGGTEGKKEKTETVEENSTDPAQDGTKEKSASTDTVKPQLAPEDSTTNSLNKLNFIFYFIYKNKYDSPAEVISRLFD
ncbi:MAG: hypothetical protein RIF46_03820 [Cyclobacteriaceae bacterium]